MNHLSHFYLWASHWLRPSDLHCSLKVLAILILSLWFLSQASDPESWSRVFSYNSYFLLLYLSKMLPPASPNNLPAPLTLPQGSFWRNYADIPQVGNIEINICRPLFQKYLFYLLFIYLTEPGLSCGTWDLVPWPEIETGPHALGAESADLFFNSSLLLLASVCRRKFIIWLISLKLTGSPLLLFSCSVVSSSLRPHGLQHTRPPVHHQLPELAQTHVHWVNDAIQPSHSLLSPSPAFNLSQHQVLFKWVSSSHQVAKVLELQLWHQSFQWTPRTDLL